MSQSEFWAVSLEKLAESTVLNGDAWDNKKPGLDLSFLPQNQNSFLVVCLFWSVIKLHSNMASKLVRHSHLKALSSSISINNRIRSPHFSNPNPNQAPLGYRLFSNAFCSSSTGGFQRASSLKDLELAKFASIAETWSAFLFPLFFNPLFGW